ncbi:FUSC family protein [Terrisporobacter glycolicus]|uniref:Integral membrane bound transporter domain-containing protein n=1 Tax=Terrisporobacter glycolicus ATCC 14880 = DSM 1288 TaxID=1121315 RepID=A0ABZ2EUR6_9FIRM|nr:FUSC family protein [Terrisporobacter glycolicus]
MSFYQAMQLGASQLKPLIKEESDKKLKQKYIGAFITKNILCMLFCILVVSSFSNIFGKENSIVGVVTVILILTFRFANLDFKVKQSAITLIGIFLIYAISPYLSNISNPILGFIINFTSIITIVILTCHNMIYANHIVLILSYFLLYGNDVSSIEVYLSRVIGLLFGGIIVASIFYTKHKKSKKEYDNTILDVIKGFDINTEKSRWQLKLALGVNTAVLIGEIFHFPKTMWIAFACMSVIHQTTKEKLNLRCKNRIVFAIVGSIAFFVIYRVFPENLRTMMPLMAGVMVGFCATYEWQTVVNSFSALPSAVLTLGLADAITFRIVSNVFGSLYSKLFDCLYDKVINHIDNRFNNEDEDELEQIEVNI